MHAQKCKMGRTENGGAFHFPHEGRLNPEFAWGDSRLTMRRDWPDLRLGKTTVKAFAWSNWFDADDTDKPLPDPHGEESLSSSESKAARLHIACVTSICQGVALWRTRQASGRRGRRQQGLVHHFDMSMVAQVFASLL